MPRVVLLFGVCLLGYLGHHHLVASHPGGALPRHTGAPGEATCATTNCHVDASGGFSNVNDGNGRVVVEGLPAQYAAGATYTFTIDVEHLNAVRFGFQATLKDAAGNDAGRLELADSNTRFIGPGVSYVTHSRATAVHTWTLRWQAPSADVGGLTLYAAGNAANGNGDRRGDFVYTLAHALSFGTGTAADEETPRALRLHRAYPNPFNAHTTLTYMLDTPMPVTVVVYDLLGRVVEEYAQGLMPAGAHEVHVAADGWAAGVYLYEVYTPSARATGLLAYRP